MKLRSLGILVITVILLNCNSVKALIGTTDSGESPSASQCSAGWCISTGNYGVRISIVNKSGQVKGKALNIMIQLSNIKVEKLTIQNRFPNASDYNAEEYLLRNMDISIQQLLKDLEIMGKGKSNYVQTVDNKIRGWGNGNSTFKKIQE